jgi:hypothetical protein
VDRVEDRALNQSLHREDEVNKCKQELAITNQEGERNPVVLELDSPVTKVIHNQVLGASFCEHGRKWAFDSQDESCFFNGAVLDQDLTFLVDSHLL